MSDASIILLTHYRHRSAHDPRAQPIPRGQQRIELVTAGRCQFFEGEELMDAETGSLLWHAEGNSTISKSDPDAPYACLNFVFSTGRSRPVGHHTRWLARESPDAFARECIAAYRDGALDRSVLCGMLLARFQWEAHRWEVSARPDGLPEGIRRVVREIQRDYGRRWTIEGMASLGDYSAAHLHALWQQHFGTSPWRYLMELRIEAARERLQHTRDPVKQIAADCGFGSAAAFCHAFRRMTGLRPGAIRG